MPESLETLIFGESFNTEIKMNVLPKNLKELIFELKSKYEHAFKKDVLQKSLIRLCFGDKYNCEIDENVLPESLQHIVFGHYYNRDIKKDVLPLNLKTIKIKWEFQKKIVIPEKTKELFITCNNELINNLPEHIEKIHIFFDDDEKFNKDVSNLPMSLKEIIIKNKDFAKYILKIPFGCVIKIK